MTRQLKKIIVPDEQGNPVEYEVDGVDATTATAGQAPIADGQGGWAWGDVATSSGSAPTPVSRASDMTDTSKIYLYTGSESGYNTGHIYYYDGSAWVDGGEYGGGGGSITVDSALSGTSTNPVQNKVITEALNGKESKSNLTDANLDAMTSESHVLGYLDASTYFSGSYWCDVQTVHMSFSTARYMQTVKTSTFIALRFLNEQIWGAWTVLKGYANASTTSAGLMSATDKSNLDTLYADYLSASTALG